jgi:hypothetical protein
MKTCMAKDGIYSNDASMQLSLVLFVIQEKYETRDTRHEYSLQEFGLLERWYRKKAIPSGTIFYLHRFDVAINSKNERRFPEMTLFK